MYVFPCKVTYVRTHQSQNEGVHLFSFIPISLFTQHSHVVSLLSVVLHTFVTNSFAFFPNKLIPT